MAIHVGQGIKGHQVVEVLEELRLFQGILPKKIQVDNGSEFISKEMDRWAYQQKVELIFSRPGKPTDNAYIDRVAGAIFQWKFPR